MLNKLISYLNKIPRLYLILASMTLLLLFFFLWNEKQSLSIDKKIDHEKFTNFFVTLFTVIGTILSLYFSQKAIKTDVMPEIYP